MNRFRFSIGSFLLVVTLLALGLGAIVSQAELAGTLGYTCFVSLLCLAAAVATGPPTARRAFCVGFAIFGGTYWFTEFSESSPPAAVNWPRGFSARIPRQSDPVVPHLITRDLLHLIQRSLSPKFEIGSPVMAAWSSNGYYYDATIVQAKQDEYEIQWVDGKALQWTPASLITSNSRYSLIAGHALMGGLFALLGGVSTALCAGEKSGPQSCS